MLDSAWYSIDRCWMRCQGRMCLGLLTGEMLARRYYALCIVVSFALLTLLRVMILHGVAESLGTDRLSPVR
ncbi:unnamed protein product [Linum tenue]|uniref:Uncharacterized protein n=1 Tax=Linum tenue TaxID=586396 RepID=A0AAV0P2S6_9ROSI|nr:unnamed protein product [Linum tenue]